jgi:hypothetical protein
VVDRELRPLLRQIANPLKLGEMHEEAFILGDHWRQHFLRKAAEVGGPITVAKLRAWTDEPVPAGLTKDVQNLVILVFAEQTSRSFFLHGGPAQGALDNLPDELELREQALPAAADWSEAGRRAAAILGVAALPIATAASVSQLAAEAKRVAGEHRAACSALHARLEARAQGLGVGSDTSRLRTARAAERFVEGVHAATLDDVVTAIVRAPVETTAEAMGTSIKKAAALVDSLERVTFELFDAISRLADDRAARVAGVLDRLREAFGKDELALGLEPVLRGAEAEALRLLAPPAQVPSSTPAVARPGARQVESAERRSLDPDAARALFGELEGKLRARPGRRLSVRWEIEESGEAR